MKAIDNLLSEAIDMHVHAYPDMSLKHPQSLSNRDVIE